MTRDDIIRMARECGWAKVGREMEYPVLTARLERFAALVAAAERERMKFEGWRQCAEGQRTTQFCGLLADAVKAEREACAKVCEDIPLPKDPTQFTHIPTIVGCAAAIRARGR